MQNIHFQHKEIAFYYVFLGILLLIRIYQLQLVAPFDYDSVYNYQILEQIAVGNYQNIFYHASPTFYTIFSIFYAISSDFWFLLYCNAFIGTLAIHIFVATFRKHNVYLLLFLGSSLLLVANSRYLSIEGISLLGSALLWNKIKYFFDVSKNYSQKNQELTSGFALHLFYFSFAFLLLFLLLSNYKALVPIFFMFMGFVIAYRNKFLLSKLPLAGKKTLQSNDCEGEEEFTLYIKVIYLSIIYFFLGLFLVVLASMLLGQRWYQYPATIFSIVATAKNTSASTFDFGYYFRYIFSFENPFLLIFLAIAFVFFIRNYKQTEDFRKIIWLVFLGTFLTMTLLAKAPRGLIFCLPLGYYLAFEGGLHISRYLKSQNRWLFFSLIAVMLFFQVKHIFSEIYDYTPTNYPKVAQYLQKNDAQVVFSTLGLSVYPYLDKNIQLVVMREAKDTMLFKSYSGKKFFLYDAYAEVAKHQSLISLKKTSFDTTFSEKSLLSNMLYLENSEYNKLTFSQSIEAALKARQEAFQVGVKKIK